MLATRWIAVHAERQPEYGLRAIVLIFTAPGQPVSGGSSPHWFLQCKHFRFGIKTNKFSDRPPVFLTGAGNLFLKYHDVRMMSAIGPKRTCLSCGSEM